jgi:nucleolar protein 9
VRQIFEELGPHLSDLISRRRSGVMAALIASCGRMGLFQKEACQTLEKALVSSQSWASGLAPEKVLAPALLCLDSLATLSVHKASTSVSTAEGGGFDDGSHQKPRLSTLGCSILACLLGYGQGACRTFTDSVAALKGHDAYQVASDPSGSRVIEALIEGTAPTKVKMRMMEGLKGGFGRIAMTGAGSFVVEKCYSYGDAGMKEAVVSELLKVKRELEAKHWGPSLLRKVGAEAYVRDPEQWRRHNESSSKMLLQYEQMFSSRGDDGGGSKKGKKTKEVEKGVKAMVGSSSEAVAFLAEIDEGEEGQKKMKKGKKNRTEDLPEADASDPVESIMKDTLGYQLLAEGKSKKKPRKV